MFSRHPGQWPRMLCQVCWTSSLMAASSLGLQQADAVYSVQNSSFGSCDGTVLSRLTKHVFSFTSVAGSGADPLTANPAPKHTDGTRDASKKRRAERRAMSSSFFLP